MSFACTNVGCKSFVSGVVCLSFFLTSYFPQHIYFPSHEHLFSFSHNSTVIIGEEGTAIVKDIFTFVTSRKTGFFVNALVTIE